MNHSFLGHSHQIALLYSAIKLCVKWHKQMIFELWYVLLVDSDLMAYAQKALSIILVSHTRL